MRYIKLYEFQRFKSRFNGTGLSKNDYNIGKMDFEMFQHLFDEIRDDFKCDVQCEDCSRAIDSFYMCSIKLSAINIYTPNFDSGYISSYNSNDGLPTELDDISEETIETTINLIDNNINQIKNFIDVQLKTAIEEQKSIKEILEIYKDVIMPRMKEYSNYDGTCASFDNDTTNDVLTITFEIKHEDE